VHFGERLLRLARVQTAHVIAQGDRGAHGALGVVLMDERDTEHRHEPVPHHLRNVAAELSTMSWRAAMVGRRKL
jgi:hypothetical protein